MSYDVVDDDTFPRNVTVSKPDPKRAGHFVNQTITATYRILDTSDLEALTDKNRGAINDGSSPDSDITRIRENLDKVLVGVSGFKRGTDEMTPEDSLAYALKKSHICIAIHNEYWVVVKKMNEARKGN